jgi:hypothetical protein
MDNELAEAIELWSRAWAGDPRRLVLHNNDKLEAQKFAGQLALKREFTQPDFEQFLLKLSRSGAQRLVAARPCDVIQTFVEALGPTLGKRFIEALDEDAQLAATALATIASFQMSLLAAAEGQDKLAETLEALAVARDQGAQAVDQEAPNQEAPDADQEVIDAELADDAGDADETDQAPEVVDLDDELDDAVARELAAIDSDDEGGE